MKIGVLSDIHGNHYALEAVLELASKEKVEKILVLGDIVGYYYYPDRVLKMLNQWDCLMIKGNHETIIEQLLAGKIQEADVRKKYGSGHKYAMEKLNTKELDWITMLPDRNMVSIDGVNFLMCHGAPWDANFYLYPDTDRKVLGRCGEYGADIVLTGHSHYSFVAPVKNGMLVNAGSVGQSRSMGGVAFWTLINTANKSIEIKTCPYNTADLIKAIENTDPDIPYLKNILSRNR